MAYCTQADIELEIPAAEVAQLSDDTNGTSTNSAIVTRAIANADTTINRYLRGKQTVVFSTVPDSVRHWSVGLSIYNLYKRRIDLTIPDTITEEKEQIIDELKEVRDSEALIDDSTSDNNTANMYVSKGVGSSETKELFGTNSSGTGDLDCFFSGI